MSGKITVKGIASLDDSISESSINDADLLSGLRTGGRVTTSPSGLELDPRELSETICAHGIAEEDAGN